MSVTRVPQVYYLVALGYTLIDRPGTADDVKYIQMLGTFENLEDAKEAIDGNAQLIADNDNQHLTLYKVDLEQNRLFTFYRKDLQEPIAKAMKYQKQRDAFAAERTKMEMEKEQSAAGGQPWVFHVSENV